jgi:hypothetical protein
MTSPTIKTNLLQLEGEQQYKNQININ